MNHGNPGFFENLSLLQDIGIDYRLLTKIPFKKADGLAVFDINSGQYFHRHTP